MLNIRSINPDPQLSVALAIYFARLSLPVWKKKYSRDLRPEKAIEAAEKILLSAADAAASADAAANAANAASADSAYAYAANAAAAYSYAAYAAYASADAAYAYAANAAAGAAYSYAAYAAYASADAAYAYAANAAAGAAANALGENAGLFIHHHLVRLLPVIIWHKLNSRRSFGESEKVFELLPEACREDFLFSLDSLR